MKGFFDASLLGAKAAISQIPACGACGLYKVCRSPKMEPFGEGRKKILIVSESPGEEEDRKKRPYTGNTGRYFVDILASFGVNALRDCWLTNALICFPADGKGVTDSRIDYCRPNLFNTIEELQPNVIIPIGGSAVKSLIGRLWKKDKGSIARWAGFQIPNQRPNVWICPTYNPAFVLRSSEKEKNPVPEIHFKHHLKKAISLEERPWDELPEYEKQVQVLIDPTEATYKLKRFLKQRPRLVAFDYETNMLKPDSQEATIYSCAVSDADTTLAYPWHGEAKELTKQLLMDKTIGKIASNLKFEQRWTIEEFGTGVKGWAWDTMQAAHILDNRKAPITGLKFQAYVYLGAESYDDHIASYLDGKDSNKPNRIKQADLKQLLKYNGLDALLEILLAKIQMKQAKYDKWEQEV